MTARLCPHCDVKTNFDHKQDFEGYWGREPKRTYVSFHIRQCQNCRGLITIVHRQHQKTWVEWFVYPQSIPSVDDAVPTSAKADYIEGVECLGIDANKAAATMFRRSLQQVIIDKNAPAGKRLVDQIATLVEVGELPKDIGEWATEIRLWGK